jgi:hypothetical protein
MLTSQESKCPWRNLGKRIIANPVSGRDESIEEGCLRVANERLCNKPPGAWNPRKVLEPDMKVGDQNDFKKTSRKGGSGLQP